MASWRMRSDRNASSPTDAYTLMSLMASWMWPRYMHSSFTGLGLQPRSAGEGLDDARVGQDVHVAPEELCQILLEPDEVKERSVLVHLNQQIHVAVRPVNAACDGTEYTHVPRAVLSGDAQDLFATPVNRHGWHSKHRSAARCSTRATRVE